MLYIFDWDGTLCNSLHRIVSCTQAAAREVGMAVPTDDAVKDIIGLSLPNAIHRVFPGISEAEFKALMACYARHFKSEKASPIDFYPRVLETLQALHDDGHHLAVATGKSRVGLDRVLVEMEVGHLFHGSRCADETQSKPHPKMLEELLVEFSLTPQEAVMIGDTEYDMDMAKQLDMPRIAVSYGAHVVERLIPFEPVLCVDSLHEILTWQP